MRLPPRQKTRLQVRQTSRLSAAIQRVFKSFRRNEGSTDHGIIPTIELLSDFSVTWKFSSLGTNTATMWGTELKLKAALSAAGKLTMLVGDGESWKVNRPSDTAYNDGLLRKAEIRKTGDLYELLVENVVIASVYNAENVTPEISQFYRKSVGGEVFPGILADLEVYDDGVLVRDYPINDNSNILANRATVLGPNLNETSDPFNSVLIGGPPVTFYDAADAISGVSYLVSVSISNYSGSGSVGVGGGNGVPSNVNSRSDDGELLFVFTATSNFKLQLFNRSSNQCTFSNVSVRQADGYGNLVNGTADQWGLFRKQPTLRKPRLYRVNKSTTDYVQLPIATLSTDSKISFDVQADLSEHFYCFGNDTGFNSRLSILEDGSFNVRTDTNLTAFDAPAGTIQSGVFTNLEIRLLGGVIEVFIDKVSIGTNTTDGAFNINTIFKNSDAVSGKGVVANFKLEDAGVVVRDYAIDDNNSTLLDKISAEDGTVVNGDTTDWFYGLGVGGEWLGENLVTNGGFSGNSAWAAGSDGVLDIVNGKAYLTEISGRGRFGQQIDTLLNTKLRISANVVSKAESLVLNVVTSNSSNIVAETNILVNVSTGLILIDWVATTSNSHFGFIQNETGATNWEVVMDNVSIKEVLDVV
jgi:hypothetical protein